MPVLLFDISDKSCDVLKQQGNYGLVLVLGSLFADSLDVKKFWRVVSLHRAKEVDIKFSLAAVALELLAALHDLAQISCQIFLFLGRVELLQAIRVVPDPEKGLFQDGQAFEVLLELGFRGRVHVLLARGVD